MEDNRKIGIAIPTYQRVELTMQSFDKVYYDTRVGHIAIVDDASGEPYFQELLQKCEKLDKAKVWSNASNLDCYFNKWAAMSFCPYEWDILLDSDNQIDSTYIDKLYQFDEWEEDTIYTPDFAYPHFDFRRYSGLTITKENVASYIDLPMFETMLNAANYFVNREQYCNIWDQHTDPVTSDSIYMSYLWLKAGNKIKVVEGMQYFHRVHEGSHYKNNVNRTPNGFHESILQQLREMK